MKIKKDENLVELKRRLDVTANPLLALYSNGDPKQNPDSHLMRLQQVVVGDLRSQKTISGRPSLFALEYGAVTKLHLWPSPDQEYHAVLEFNPPRERI